MIFISFHIYVSSPWGKSFDKALPEIISGYQWSGSQIKMEPEPVEQRGDGKWVSPTEIWKKRLRIANLGWNTNRGFTADILVPTSFKGESSATGRRPFL